MVFLVFTDGATGGASHGESHTPYTSHQSYNSGTTSHCPHETVRTRHRMGESPEACTRRRVAPWPHPIHGSTDCRLPSCTTHDPSLQIPLHTCNGRSARDTNPESPLFADAAFQIWFHTGGCPPGTPWPCLGDPTWRSIRPIRRPPWGRRIPIKFGRRSFFTRPVCAPEGAPWYF